MSSLNLTGQPSAVKCLPVDHSLGKPMCTDNGYQDITQRPLSDETAVEILDFLQVLITDFENRYASQINRYYAQRRQLNHDWIKPSGETDVPPF